MRRRKGLPSYIYIAVLVAMALTVIVTKACRGLEERPELFGPQSPPCNGTDIVGADWIVRLCDRLDAIIRVDLRERVVTGHPFLGDVVAMASNPRGELALATSDGPILIVDRQFRSLGQFDTAPGGRAWGLAWMNDRWEAADLTGVYWFDGTGRGHIPYSAPAQWRRFLGIELIGDRWTQLWWTRDGIVAHSPEGTHHLCTNGEDEVGSALSQGAMTRGRGLLVQEPLYLELTESELQPSRKFEAASFSDDPASPDVERTTCLRVRRETDSCERFFVVDPAGVDFADRCWRGEAVWLGERDDLAITNGRLSSTGRSVTLPDHHDVLLVDPRGRYIVLDPGLRRAVIYDADLNVESDLRLEHRASAIMPSTGSELGME